MSSANPISVPVQTNGPCNHRGELTGELSEEHRTIYSLESRIRTVISLIERAKTTNIPKMLSTSDKQGIVDLTFLPQEYYSNTGGNFTTYAVDAAGELDYFYEEIFKLKFYIDVAANGFALHGPDSIKGDLRIISSTLQQILCDIYIEFSYHNGDVSTLPAFHIFNPSFDLDDQTLLLEAKRAYVLLNDSENLMASFGMLVANHISASAQ